MLAARHDDDDDDDDDDVLLPFLMKIFFQTKDIKILLFLVENYQIKTGITRYYL